MVTSHQQQQKHQQQAAPPSPTHTHTLYETDFDMGSIEVVGFDYDYTLANYTEQLPKLLYDLAMDYLVKRLKYPVGLQSPDICYDPNFAIRGTAVHTERARRIQ